MTDNNMRSDRLGSEELRRQLPWWIQVQIEMSEGKYYERVYRDCGINASARGDWYMLSDDVWAATGMAPAGGVLCLVCVERRLGRDLQEEDFGIADEGDREGGFGRAIGCCRRAGMRTGGSAKNEVADPEVTSRNGGGIG